MRMTSFLLSGCAAVGLSLTVSNVGIAQTVPPAPHFVPAISNGRVAPAEIVVCNRCVWHPEDNSWHCKIIKCPPPPLGAGL